MTLMNGFTNGQSAFLYSDTAYTHPVTQEVVGYAPKAFEVPWFPAAVAFTAIGPNPQSIVTGAIKSRPKNLRRLLADCRKAARKFTAQASATAVRMLVAGWCRETGRARLFLITSDLARPFEAIEVDHLLCTGNQSPRIASEVAQGLNPERMEAIAEVQRAEPFVGIAGDYAPGGSIGGELVEFAVTRHGVTERVVRDWRAVHGGVLRS